MHKMEQKTRRIERAIEDFNESATHGECQEALQRIINVATDLMKEAELIKGGKDA